MMKTHLLLSALFLTLLFPATVIAATLTGVVKSVVPPYLLVRTAIGHEVVRIVEGGGLGNTDSLGHLKSGRERVEVEWSEERNRIKIASSITRLPVYTVYPAIEVPIEQAATWQNLESGPDKHLMIDVRPTSEWEEGHILRSLSAPFEIPSGSYVPYPADRHGKIILYGGHSQERLVHRAAQKTIVTGYDNVRVYSGGVEDWSRHGKPLGITAAGAKRRIERKEPLLVVDIRDKDAWLAGHISGSISAPAGSFSHTLLTVPNMNNPYPVLLVGSSVQEGLSYSPSKTGGATTMPRSISWRRVITPGKTPGIRLRRGAYLLRLRISCRRERSVPMNSGISGMRTRGVLLPFSLMSVTMMIRHPRDSYTYRSMISRGA
jgi:rhodanese-related sulfurtransferase